MSAQGWVQALLQIIGWFVVYAALFVLRGWFERWLIARFRNQGQVSTWLRGTRSQSDLLHTTVAIGSVLAGAVIPLAPEMAPFGHANADLLYVLAAILAGTALLPMGRQEGLDARRAPQNLGAGALLSALPLILTTVTAIVTGGALSPHGEGSLRLDRLIEAQAGWAGLRWIGVLQPLALAVWVVCSSLFLRGAEVRPTLAGQLVGHNCTLLSVALFLGGWQGPFVDANAWLGPVYTGVKALCLTFVWTWASVSLARPVLSRRVEATWLLFVPLSALNLTITAIVVATGPH